MKFLSFLTLITFTLILSGCVSEKNKADQQKIESLQATLDEQQVTIDDLKTQLESVSVSGIPQNFLAVYGMDKEAMNEEISFYLELPKNLPLLEQLKFIADKLSQHKFSGLPIEVLKIEKSDEANIAVINLKEISPDSVPSWKTGYFQGSAGGNATAVTLSRTFLQEDHVGEWIDGVEFYYEGEPMGDWDHFDLKGIKYRP